MEPRRDDTDLAAALRALRPAPRPEFTRELDARATAGFPHPDGHPATAIRHIAKRLRATPPRRFLAPAGALAVTAIVIATAVVATTEDQATQLTAPELGQPSTATDSSGVQSSEAAAGSSRANDMLLDRNSSYAAGSVGRDIERAAQVVLGTDPERVRADAAKVFDAVHAVDGIVLRSSIRDGAAGEAGAEFELLIPSGKLGDALADFSAIGEVRSRRESTQDITAPTVGARERLQDSEARIDGLLAQLAEAATETERAAVEAELRVERRQAAALRSRLAVLSRRANLSRVSLRIETGAASAANEDDSSWGVGDGVDDAGRILEIAAGATIVGLAVLTPLALIALLAWLAHRAWVRAGRKRALEQTG